MTNSDLTKPLVSASAPKKAVHIAWTAFQRRQESMREIAGFDCWFMPVPKSGKVKKAFSYLRLLLATLSRLKASSPETVWVQLPQVPALWAALIYKYFANKQIKVIADCHNAQLRKPWSSFPLAQWAINRSDAILVHNNAMRAKANELGWPEGKVIVLEDVPAVGKAQAPSGLAKAHINAAKPWVLFPGSFAADEPIEEVLDAARLTPELTFIITGRPERAGQNGHNIEHLPSNVVLPGFLPLDVFDDLLREADVVMGLTKEEGIQLSVCNEALGFGKALVTSNTQILSNMFGEAAVLVETRDPKSIAAGCQEALNNHHLYAEKSNKLATSRLCQWQNSQLTALHGILSSVKS